VAGADAALVVRSPQSTGIAGGEWCPFGLGGVSEELPLDQRIDDGNSLAFDTAALSADLEIAGAPVAELDISTDTPTGLVAVRLSDVAPEGAATRVSYGVLNLTHREGHQAPSALEAHKRYRVRVQLNDIAHHFPAGHRIRLAVSTAYWPIIWPSPEPTTLTLFTGTSSLVLPVRAPRSDDAALTPFEPSETAPPLAMSALRKGRIDRSLDRDIVTGEVEFRIHRDDGRVRNDTTGTIIDYTKQHSYRIRDDDPSSAVSEVVVTIKLERDDWRSEVRTRCTWRCTRSDFLVDTDLDVFEREQRVFCRSWANVIGRDLV